MSTTKRPGTIRLMPALTPRRRAVPRNAARMRPMRRCRPSCRPVAPVALPAGRRGARRRGAAPSFPGVLLDWRFDTLPAHGDLGRASSTVGRAAGEPRASVKPAAAASALAVPGRPCGAWLALLSPIEAYEGASSACTWCSTCSSSWSPLPFCWRGRRSRSRCARPTLGAARAAGGAPEPRRPRPLVPGGRLAPLRRGELGLALQRALRRGAREPGAPPLPARHHPGGAPSSSGGRSSVPTRRRGACPTRCASCTCSWRCRRTRSSASP